MTTIDPTTNAPTYSPGVDAPRRTAEAKPDFKTTETKSAFRSASDDHIGPTSNWSSRRNAAANKPCDRLD